MNGVAAVACNRAERGEGFEQAVVGGDALGNPLHAARWNLRYVLCETPRGAMLVPPNPLLPTA